MQLRIGEKRYLPGGCVRFIYLSHYLCLCFCISLSLFRFSLSSVLCHNGSAVSNKNKKSKKQNLDDATAGHYYTITVPSSAESEAGRCQWQERSDAHIRLLHPEQKGEVEKMQRRCYMLFYKVDQEHY
jgi:hypothetical protein